MNKIIIVIILVVEADRSFNRQSCPKFQTATSEICKLTFKGRERDRCGENVNESSRQGRRRMRKVSV
jgi:hypothetical protein